MIGCVNLLECACVCLWAAYGLMGVGVQSVDPSFAASAYTGPDPARRDLAGGGGGPAAGAPVAAAAIGPSVEGGQGDSLEDWSTPGLQARTGPSDGGLAAAGADRGSLTLRSFQVFYVCAHIHQWSSMGRQAMQVLVQTWFSGLSLKLSTFAD